MFSVHTKPLKFENGASQTHLCLRNHKQGLEITHRLRKTPLNQNVFRSQENEMPAFSNSSGLKSSSVFEKLHFGDGLVWAVGLT